MERLVAVAPPLSFFSLDGLAECTKPKLFVVGDRDEFCPVASLVQQFTHVADPKVHQVVRGADHFFAGDEDAVAEAVGAFCSV